MPPDATGTIVPLLNVFRTQRLLEQHWDFHKDDFDAAESATAADYLTLAVRFLSGLPGSTVHQCVRQRDGVTIRFNRATDVVGFVYPDGVIASFFKADPYVHRFSSNMAYIRNECAKV